MESKSFRYNKTRSSKRLRNRPGARDYRTGSLSESGAGILRYCTVLAIGTFLILLGIIINVAICFVMLRGKRFKKSNSNFLHLSVIELVIRLLNFPVEIYIP